MSNLATRIGSTFGESTAKALQSYNGILKNLNQNFTSYVPVLASVAAGFLAVGAARKAAGATFVVGDDGQRVAGLRSYIAAQYQNIAATREQQAAEARLAMERARDEIAQYKRAAGGRVNQAIMQRSPSVRLSYIQGLRDLQADLTTRTNAYQTSLKGLRTASISAGAVATTFKSAWSSVLGVFGGPLGLAFTGATMAVDGLASAIAERTALHEKYRTSLEDIGQAADAMAEKMDAATKSMLTSKLNLAQMELDQTRRDRESLQEELKGAHLGHDERAGSYGVIASFSERMFGANKGTWEAAKVLDDYQKGLIDAAQGQEKLLDLQAKFGRTDAIVNASTRMDELANATRRLAENQKTVDELNRLLGRTGEAGQSAAAGLHAAGDAAAGAVGQMAGLADMLRDSSFTAFTAGLSGAQKTFAQSMKGTLNENQLSAYFSGDFGKLSEKDAGALRDNAAQLDAIYANYKKMYALQESAKHAGRTSSAREAIQRVREEIERLNQTQPTGAAKLAQTLREIAKEGPLAGMVPKAVEALKTEYEAAFKADQVRKSAEAMLDYRREIAGLTGDARTVREVEMETTLEQWRLKFLELGESAEESAPQLAAMREALERSDRTKDIQTSVQFYKELAGLSGNLTYSLQAQNELIALQAQEYRNNGIADSLVSQWEVLKRLEASNSGWDGARRAMLAYYSEASNAGKNFETFFTNSFSTLEDALVGFVQTGKLSFSDMVNSMLADLARLAVRQNILAPLAQGLSGLFAGFTGGGTGSLGSGAAPAIQNANFGFGSSLTLGSGLHSGGMVGRTSPTFQRQVPLAAYADASRFHRGYPGLGPDEYPAILQSGERVLNREETAAYNAGRYASGGGQGSNVVFSPVINPVVIDKSGRNLDVRTNVTPNAGGGFDLEIFIAQAADAGIAKMAQGNKSQLVRYLDQSRAMGGNARSLY